MSEQAGDAERPREERVPDERRVRTELLVVADLIERLAEADALMKGLPLVINRLGDLQRLLFDYEVRATEGMKGEEEPEAEVQRILEEVEERADELAEDPDAGSQHDEGEGGTGPGES